MENVVTFYSNKPPPIMVNGERIRDEEIAAAAAQFSEMKDAHEAAARSLVVRTLLRQRALELDIEAESEESAVEQLLAQELEIASVSDVEVQRYFEGNRHRFRNGDLFEVRHILFDSTDAAGKAAVVREAEAELLQLKLDPAGFAERARAVSRCTSAELGGMLGQVSEGALVPEFWAALLAFGKTGLLPNLVESRFGHHIILIERCARGEALPFEACQTRIRDFLTAHREMLSYRQYLARLIEAAKITGINLDDQKPQPPGPGLPLE